MEVDPHKVPSPGRLIRPPRAIVYPVYHPRRYTVGGGITRGRFLGLSALGAAGLAAACSPDGAYSPEKAGGSTTSGAGPPELERLDEEIVSGGPGKDGIPPIDEPEFVSAGEMDGELDPGDVVFVLDYGGELRVYPQMVLVWHEIANDTVAGERLSVTYCPLTGSTVAFRGASPEGTPLDFGTTGRLVNSNLLMYDRQTDSEWPQILGRAVNGPMRSDSLEEIPLYWTTWELWREHGSPEAPVLSTDTGFLRSYGSDPYGSYTGDDRGYYESPDLMFPVLNESDHLPPKEVVVGIKAGEARHAIPRETILERGVLEAEVGGLPVVAVGDRELDTVTVFERRLGDEMLDLQPNGDGTALLDGRGGAGRREGMVLRGPGDAVLPAAKFYEVMWFAWHAFFPQTGLAP